MERSGQVLGAALASFLEGALDERHMMLRGLIDVVESKRAAEEH